MRRRACHGAVPMMNAHHLTEEIAMKIKTYGRKSILGLCCLCLLSAAGAVSAQSTTSDTGKSAQRSTTANNKEMQNANQHVDNAVDVVRRMESDPGLARLLDKAKGVFIVPKYGRGALIVGASGGPGVLLVKQGGSWSEPVFYTIGGISAGAQAGIEAGSLALILNSDKAVNNFMRNNKFSIDANAGLTVVNWSKQAERDAGRGDIVVWADAKGLFGGVAVSVTDINFDQKETAAYYQKNVAAQDVINGKVKNPHSSTLLRTLAGVSSATSTGESSGAGTSSRGKGESSSGQGGKQ